MANKVVKFGGSSLADAAQFRKVADIIHAEDARRYVVPSAPGKRCSSDTKVTDMLYACHELAQKGQDFSEALTRIHDRYQEIIDSLGLDFSLDDAFARIAADFRQGASRDYAASRGEFLNGMLLANYLGYTFLDAAEVIRFDQNGVFLLDETIALLRQRLAGMDRVVLPGFYGATAEGHVRTFSRGGSDVTGSILARAVKADIYENWTDVSGFLIADPRVVTDPKVISTITYEELRELSYMGATVLHEDAIFPVRTAGIPINIRNTNCPEAPGTMIVSDDNDEVSGYTITGIAGKKGFCAINMQKAMMNSELGFCRNVLRALEKNGISLEHMPSGIDTMSVLVSTDSLRDKEKAVLDEITYRVHPDHMEIENNLALIAIVGRGMRKARGTAGKIFSALAEAKVNVKMIDQGSSELNVIVGVNEEDFEDAVKALYHAFVTD